MENDFMNELEDYIAGTTSPQQTPKTDKDVLRERLRTQMGGEKRKLEDNSGEHGILSKTQKMDNDLDLDSVNSCMNNNGSQRLLAQALMEKQPLKKEQRNDELTALLNEQSNFKKMPGGGKMQPQQPPRPQMMNHDMMESGTFYHGGQPQRIPMQRPPMNNWNNMMYNNGQQPQKMNMRPQGPRGYFNDQGGPPPNAWVQPNDQNKVMMGPNGANYYNRNGCQRPPMMRPNMNNYEYNGGGQTQQGMYMRNYPMNNGPQPGPGGPMQGHQGGATGDPYARFGSPNNGAVCPPMYSPNNGNPDSMHALRMSANFMDSNAGYNGYANDFAGPPNGYNRMRPYMPPYQQHNSRGVISNNMCHTTNLDTMSFNNSTPGPGGPQQQQQQPYLEPQQQQFDNFNDFNNILMDNDWRRTSSEVRQTLLGKLKEALVSQNYPNSTSVAESYEAEAFNMASSLQEYQNKLVCFLARIFDNSHAPVEGVASATPPDSSTNGLNDVTTSSSPKVLDPSNCTGDLETASEAVKTASNDLMLATPKSEGCLSPTGSPGNTPASSCNGLDSSPLSASNVVTTASTASNVSTTPTSSASSTPTTTFQCPPPINGEAEKKTTQRRISGSSGVNGTVGNVVSSIGNNPQSVDSGIGLGSPRSITSASSGTLYSPKIQGTSPSLLTGSDNSPEKASS